MIKVFYMGKEVICSKTLQPLQSWVSLTFCQILILLTMLWEFFKEMTPCKLFSTREISVALNLTILHNNSSSNLTFKIWASGLPKLKHWGNKIVQPLNHRVRLEWILTLIRVRLKILWRSEESTIIIFHWINRMRIRTLMYSQGRQVPL
jgi:hypothetical protein